MSLNSIPQDGNMIVGNPADSHMDAHTPTPYDTAVPQAYAQNPYMLNLFQETRDANNNLVDEPFKYTDMEFMLRSPGDKNFTTVLQDTRGRKPAHDRHPDES